MGLRRTVFLACVRWVAAPAITIVAMGTSHAINQCRVFPNGWKEVTEYCVCEDVARDELYDADEACRTVPEWNTSSGVPPSPAVRPSGNNQAFILVEALNYEIGASGLKVSVPEGFVTDYASIPPALQVVYKPHDQYSRAAVIHDYLYWAQLCTRQQADNIFLIAMKESEVPLRVRNDVYLGVRLGGEGPWQRNRLEREQKMPRVVPVDRQDFPPNWSWERYRSQLILAGVTDPEFVGENYCALGNDTEVPPANPPKPPPRAPIFVQRPARG